ncbi:MAG: DMT family transporter [Hyphomicrobiaceae bacterium]|nr:DMT family transporter [Hyphomicrobiaceae bacterium]
MTNRHTDRPALAIAIMIIAVMVLVAMNACVKLIGPGYNAVQVTFIRNLIAAFVLFPFVMRDGGIASLKTRRPGLQLLRSLSGIAGVTCYFYGVQHLPIGEVTVISQATPLFVAALAVPILKESVGWRRWSAIVVGFVGVIVALGPVGQIGLPGLVVVAGTLLWAVTILTVRTLGRTDSPATTTFYYMVLGTLIAGAAQPWVWKTPPSDLWILFVAAAVFGAAGQLLIAHALRIGEASIVTPFNYTAIVWGVAVDFFLWNVFPTVWTLGGAAIITLAGLYLFRREAAVKEKS